MRKIILFLFGLIQFHIGLAQGLNHIWLLGNNPGLVYPKGKAIIDSNNLSLLNEYRIMTNWGTQATICDSTGNFLMSSNGIFIADATNDTMLGGGGLNPGTIANQWPDGLLYPNANLFLSLPSDSSKYILIHHSAAFNGSYFPAFDLMYTMIDISKNAGKGEVISKNNIFFSDTLCWGFAACKHANGTDWWVVIKKDATDDIFVFLLNNTGITFQSKQKLNVPSVIDNVTHISFTQQGNKMGYNIYTYGSMNQNYALLFDFDRCTGTFSNPHQTLLDKGYLWGDAFSASGNFFYTCSRNYIFQINTTTYNVDTVAVYDGFQSAGLDCDFFNLYLAANGKIYITSGSSVQHIGVINHPDSGGLACDVQQHSIDFVNFLHLRLVPNHPNYYLGCDTTLGCGCATSYNQYSLDDDKFKIYPNPNNGSFNIGYKAIATTSLLKVIDVNGRVVHQQNLPPWSNEQSIKLQKLNNGMYNLKIENSGSLISKKFILLNE